MSFADLKQEPDPWRERPNRLKRSMETLSHATSQTMEHILEVTSSTVGKSISHLSGKLQALLPFVLKQKDPVPPHQIKPKIM